MNVLDPDLLLRAYAIGVFPMSDSRDARDVYWVEPRRRAIIPLDGFHMSKSLRKTLRSGGFEVTLDRAFAEVVRRCAEREDTWINESIERSYNLLHSAGHAHSVEVWLDGELVGGLYGVRLGAAFFGESMFSSRPDASKVGARLAGGAVDRRRLPAARLPVHDRASAHASARSRSSSRPIWRCWRRRSAAAPSGGAGVARAAPAEFGALDRLLAAPARRLAAAGMGHRAAHRPHVVDRVLDGVERRRFLVEPARKDALELPLRIAHVDLDEGAGQLLDLPGRGGLAGAQPNDHVAVAHRLAGPQREFPHLAVALVEEPHARRPARPSAWCRARPR